MTASPVTVTPATHVNHAITIMLHRRFSCLPVIEKGQICGILTASDMMMTLQCLMKLVERVDQSQEPSENMLAAVDDFGNSITAAAGYTAG